jgi:hypothetical protein
MTFPSGHLAANPLPSGIVGSLEISGYQLLADVAGVGAGRLGRQVFLLVVAEPEENDHITQISLHNPRLSEEKLADTYVALAAQLGVLRLSGYRLVPERDGIKSRIKIVNPATGAIVLTVPQKHPGGIFGGGGGWTAQALLASARKLPPPGDPPDLRSPELLSAVLLELALADDEVAAVDAPDLVDGALQLVRANPALDAKQALEAAKEAS